MPLLEIEQKFSFNAANLARLLRNPNFSAPQKSSFHDTYFDSGNRLSNAGLWLRKRRHLYPKSSSSSSSSSSTGAAKGGEEWEAKRSVRNGSFLRSTFVETKDLTQIRELLRCYFPHPDDRSNRNELQNNNFGLDPIAAFETKRATLVAKEEEDDREFSVVLDVTDFGHEVGEVEVMAEEAGAEKAHGEIERFLKRYPWFFDTRSPKGKLTAYFEMFGYPKEEKEG